jgi:hypothetical protein
MPQRIQRKRTKGWKMPPNTVSVTRPGRYGNPYFPGCGIGFGYDDEKPLECVAMFRIRMREMKQNERARFEALVAPLRGKNLACWCALDQPCHADVLLKIANSNGETQR